MESAALAAATQPCRGHRLTSVHAGLSFRWSAVLRHSPYRRMVAKAVSSTLRCEHRRNAAAGEFPAQVLGFRGCVRPAVDDHRRGNRVQITRPIAVRQAETHVESRLIGRLVLVFARYECVAAGRALQLRCGDDLSGRTDDLLHRLSIGHGRGVLVGHSGPMSIDHDKARPQNQRHHEGGPQQCPRLWRPDPLSAVHDGSYPRPAIPLINRSQTASISLRA